MEDRRKEPRRRVARKAYVADAEGRFFYFCFIRDASKSGCRIYSPDVLDMPKQVWIFPDGLNMPIQGTIVWRRKHMAGVHITADAAVARPAFQSSSPGQEFPTFEEIDGRIAARAAASRQAPQPAAAAARHRGGRVGQMRDYLATVVHELRTPITSIGGALSLVISKALHRLPKRFQELLLIADRNTRRLETVVNDFLDAEKLERGKIEVMLRPEDVNLVAREAVAADAQFMAMHDVTCRVEALDRPARARIDKARIQQVLSNLISNAVKFSPPGAEIVVRVERRDGMIRVSVTDHGVGIPREAQARIFNRFEQADPALRGSAGTGLGLSICQSIVALHGSTIRVESEPGHGAVFSFDLPEIPAAAEAATETA